MGSSPANIYGDLPFMGAWHCPPAPWCWLLDASNLWVPYTLAQVHLNSFQINVHGPQSRSPDAHWLHPHGAMFCGGEMRWPGEGG